MSLAENLKTAQDNRSNPPPKVEVVPTPTSEPVPTLEVPSVTDVMSKGLPGHESIKEVASPEVAPNAEGQVPEQVFKIGNESFSSIEDAMNHAQKLDREKLERDAYELGKQDSVPKVEEVKTDPDAEFYKQMGDLMFENPTEAIKMIETRAVEKATSTIKQSTETQTAKDQAWSKFYEDNKDLVTHKKYVDFYLNENWGTLGPMQPDKALQKLAEITKEGLNDIVKSMRPEEVLSSEGAQVTSTSGEPVTQVAVQKQKLDFTQQIRKLNKRELKDIL